MPADESIYTRVYACGTEAIDLLLLENSFSLQRESDKEKNETCIASKHLFTKFTFTYHFSRRLGQLGRSRKVKSKNFLFIEVRHSSFHQSHQRMKKSPSVKTIIYKNTWLSYLFCISINVLDLISSWRSWYKNVAIL